MKILIEHSVDVNSTANYNSRTPLLISVKNNYFEMTKLLLDHGADPNVPYEYAGSEPLPGCTEPDPQIMKLLIKYGGSFDRNIHYWFGI